MLGGLRSLTMLSLDQSVYGSKLKNNIRTVPRSARAIATAAWTAARNCGESSDIFEESGVEEVKKS